MNYYVVEARFQPYDPRRVSFKWDMDLFSLPRYVLDATPVAGSVVTVNQIRLPAREAADAPTGPIHRIWNAQWLNLSRNRNRSSIYYNSFRIQLVAAVLRANAGLLW